MTVRAQRRGGAAIGVPHRAALVVVEHAPCGDLVERAQAACAKARSRSSMRQMLMHGDGTRCDRPASRSITPREVDDAGHRLAALERADLAAICATVSSGIVRPDDVRRDRDLGPLPERMRGRQRLLAEHVERRARRACPRRSAQADRLRPATLPRPMFTTCAPSARRIIAARSSRPVGRRRRRQHVHERSRGRRGSAELARRRRSSARPRSSLRAARIAAHGEASARASARAIALPMTPSPMTPRGHVARARAADAAAIAACCWRAVRIEPLHEAHRGGHRIAHHLRRHAGILDADQRHVARQVRHAQHVAHARAHGEHRLRRRLLERRTCCSDTRRSRSPRARCRRATGASGSCRSSALRAARPRRAPSTARRPLPAATARYASDASRFARDRRSSRGGDRTGEPVDDAIRRSRGSCARPSG